MAECVMAVVEVLAIIVERCRLCSENSAEVRALGSQLNDLKELLSSEACNFSDKDKTKTAAERLKQTVEEAGEFVTKVERMRSLSRFFQAEGLSQRFKDLEKQIQGDINFLQVSCGVTSVATQKRLEALLLKQQQEFQVWKTANQLQMENLAALYKQRDADNGKYNENIRREVQRALRSGVSTNAELAALRAEMEELRQLKQDADAAHLQDVIAMLASEGRSMAFESDVPSMHAAHPHEIPDEFLCPISGEVMEDPVLIKTGFTFEREQINEWAARNPANPTCPLTREQLTSTEVLVNRALKQSIERYHKTTRPASSSSMPSPAIGTVSGMPSPAMGTASSLPSPVSNLPVPTMGTVSSLPSPAMGTIRNSQSMDSSTVRPPAIWLPHSLHDVVAKGNEELVRSLLDNGADVNGLNETRQSPLYVAIANSQLAVVEMLVAAGADVNRKVEVAVTHEEVPVQCWVSPLRLAGDTNQPRIMSLLLKHGAKVEESFNQFGLSLMTCMAQQGHAKALSVLLEQRPELLEEAQGFQGAITPLHYAARAGHVDAAKVLLDHTANVNAAEKVNAYTPLHEAAQHGHMEMVKLLLENGANKTLKTKGKNTAVSLAANAAVRSYIERAPQRRLLAMFGSWSAPR